MTHSTAKIGKKALSVLIALTLVLALAVPAMAEYDYDAVRKEFTVDINPVKKVEGSDFDMAWGVDWSSYYALSEGLTVTVTNNGLSKFGAYISGINIACLLPDVGDGPRYLVTSDGSFCDWYMSGELESDEILSLKDGESYTLDLTSFKFDTGGMDATWKNTRFMLFIFVSLPGEEQEHCWTYNFYYNGDNVSENEADTTAPSTDSADTASVTEDGITLTLKNAIGKTTAQIAGNQSIGYGTDGYGIEVKEPMTVDVYVVKAISGDWCDIVNISVTNNGHDDPFYSRVIFETYSDTIIDWEKDEEIVSEDGYLKDRLNDVVECLPEKGETADCDVELMFSADLYAVSAGGAIIFFTTNTPAEEPTGWAAEEVNAAIDAGLVPTDRQYGYKETISRLEVAGMFTNLIGCATRTMFEDYIYNNGIAVQDDVFSDTTDYGVQALNALGIINGVGGGKFDPDGTFTRAQVIAILNRVAKLFGVDVDGYTHSFPDTAGHWVDGELGWAVANGIVKGDDNGNFNPDAPVLYEEAIAFTVRALNVLKAE